MVSCSSVRPLVEKVSPVHRLTYDKLTSLWSCLIWIANIILYWTVDQILLSDKQFYARILLLCSHVFIMKIDILISGSCAPLFTCYVGGHAHFLLYITHWLIFYSSADWIRWWLGLWRSLWYCVLLCTAHIISTMKIILLNSWITKFLQVGTTYQKI